MRRAFATIGCAALLLIGLSTAGSAQAATGSGPADGVLGDWLTDTQDAVINVYHCGDEVCGRIVGMIYTGAIPTDYRHHSKCGLTFIYAMRPEPNGDDVGHLFNPDTGSVYSARIRLLGPNTLSLRGYLVIPLLGGSKTWTRYHGTIGTACRMPGSG